MVYYGIENNSNLYYRQFEAICSIVSFNGKKENFFYNPDMTMKEFISIFRNINEINEGSFNDWYVTYHGHIVDEDDKTFLDYYILPSDYPIFHLSIRMRGGWY